jgi:hypothetical protein
LQLLINYPFQKTKAMKKKKNEEPIILGQEYANAQKVDKDWEKQPNRGASLMPQEDYASIKHGYSLIDPAVTPLDTALLEICKKFSSATQDERSKTINTISMNEFYTLLNFSKRAAVFGIREGSAAWVKAGLAACAMIDITRIDFRDIYLSLGLIGHAMKKLYLNADEVFSQTAELALPDVAEIMLRFAQDSDEHTLYIWGYDEIETEHGIGLIGSHAQAYAPTHDLKQISLALFGLIDEDEEYTAQGITVSDFPKVWLRTEENEPRLDELERAMQGCILVDGKLAPEKHPKNRDQTLYIFLLEMENEEQVSLLDRFSHEKALISAIRAGVKAQNLFGLVIARSVMKGVDHFETQDSIQRFAKGAADILAKHTRKA